MSESIEFVLGREDAAALGRGNKIETPMFVVASWLSHKTIDAS